MAVISYKCPNCGGELVFDPATQNYKCEYCVSLFSQNELEDMKSKTAEEQEPAEEYGGAAGGQEDASGAAGQEEAVVYICPSCGAQLVTEDTTAATCCYYCHNPVVLSGRLSGEFLPDRILPFAIDKKQAEQRFLEFVHRKKFVPRSFFRKQQMERLSGVYFPYWIYECSLEGSLDAQATNIRVWRSGDMEYTETKYYQIERRGTVELKGLTKNALKKNDHKLASGVLPYDLSKAKEFHTGYLSGFQAERRDVESASLAEEIRKEVQGYGQQLLRDTISGYSTVTVSSQLFHAIKETWSYVLLPVWTLTYRGKNGKLYYYSLNGQTGKAWGELPVDYKKVAFAGGIVALLVFLLFLAGGFFLWN